MATMTTPVSTPESEAAAAAEPRLAGGWRIVARKEIADHLRSARFVLLIIVLTLAGLASVHSASTALRTSASGASGTPSVFLYLFTISPERVPSFLSFVGFLAPLLGIAFGFDAINGERAQRTLPRLVAQPIHRDDVINGKFVAGLAVIALPLGAVIAIVAGYGIVRLGITPSGSDVIRLVAYFVLAVVYVALWLAVAIFCSVVTRRPATSAFTTIALWLVLTFFAGLIAGVIADTMHPTHGATDSPAVYANARLEQRVRRFSPEELYEETTQVLLDPGTRSTSSVLSASQVDQAIPSSLPLNDSIDLAWWQVFVLAGMACVAFGAAYYVFMRQEVRA
jgi:ABC-2 type transport system permease protein